MNGDSTAPSCPTTSRSNNSTTTTESSGPGRTPLSPRSPLASTSSCPAPSATATCSGPRSKRGGVAMPDVDEAVRRVLESKLRLGLFERPYVDVDRVAVHTRTGAQIELSRQLATESLVLLRNDGTLPLRPGIASIALIGPNAANARQMLGDYSYVTHVEVAARSAEVRPERVRHADRPWHRHRRAHRSRARRHRARCARRGTPGRDGAVRRGVLDHAATIDRASRPPSRRQRRATSLSW